MNLNHFKTKISLLLSVVALMASANAADISVSDSIIALATNGSKNLTFTEPISGANVVIALTMSPYSTNAAEVFSVLDGATRLGVGASADGNWFESSEGVDFTASLVSVSQVDASSVQFRISSIGFRPGGSQNQWTSSSTASAFAVSSEGSQTLDTSLTSLAGAVYTGQLRSTGGQYQLSNVGALAGQSIILNAVFTVNQTSAPVVTSHPSNQTTCAGETVSFVAAASGTPTPSVRWQTKGAAPLESFADIPNATNTTLTVTASSQLNGHQFRAKFENSVDAATTSAATLTLANPVEPTILPSPATVCPNSAGNTATCPDSSITGYAWTISNGTITSGANQQTVTYSAGGSGTVSLGLTITNASGCTAFGSNPVTMSSLPDPTISLAQTSVFEGSTGNTASAPSGATTYSWTISNGTITSATNLQSISYTAGAVGTVELTLIARNNSGCAATASAQAIVNSLPGDPRTNSWMTSYSSRYARIYGTDVAKTNGTTATTWTNGSMSQALPAYCGVQEIYSSTNYVYIRTTGLGSHTMGPWYNDATRTTLFINYPKNQKALARFPRTPVVPVTKTATQGDLGYFVDGVRMFDSSDAVSYSTSNSRDGDAPGTPGGVTGNGIWNRDAYVNEAITFDTALAHQQNTGVYHYHANPIGTRYLLGDHIDLNAISKAFTESTNSPTRHSPIVGWIKDGFPLYGPYGFSNATNSASGLRRMVSGYILRNGANGTTNLATTGRTTLPLWAARAYNRSTTLTSSEYGPAVGASFPLGRYLEDNDYLGDRGFTQGTDFDLDEYNGRFCVTPEFPNGTYAYFVTIAADGSSTFPYNVGRRYYGNPTGGTVTNIAETVTTNFLGGTNIVAKLNLPKANGSTVTLTWSGVEGGAYRVESSTNLATWLTNAVSVSASAYTNTTTDSQKYYRIALSAVAAFDPASGTVATGGGSEGISSVSPASGNSGANNLSLTITLNSSYVPAPPPNSVSPSSVTLTKTGAATITATSSSRNATTGVVTSVFNLVGATPGTYTINAVFGPNTWSLTNGFTVN